MSRFSETCVGRIEGWTPERLPEVEDQDARQFGADMLIVHVPYALPDDDDDELAQIAAESRRILPAA